MKSKNMNIFCLLVTQLVLTSVQSFRFNVTDHSGKGFEVTIGDLKIFEHSVSSPMLFVGKGSTQFEEISGNFFINDYTSERIGLTHYTLKKERSSWHLNLTRDNYFVQLGLSSSSDQDLVIKVVHSNGNYNRLWLRVVAEADEKVYGGGEQFSYLNLRHRDNRKENVFPIWTSEQGVGRNKSTQVTFVADSMGKSGGNYYTTYYPQPTFVSSRKFSFHHAGNNYAVLDFRHEKFHEIYIQDKPSNIYINRGDTLMNTVRNLTYFLGPMWELPEWIQSGAILGVQGGTKTLLERYQYAKEHKIPVSAMWIQDWSGKRDTPFGQRVNWDWKWDKKWYPDLDKVIGNLSKEGVRIMGYINPNLDHRSELFKEGAAKGYFVKNSTGGIYYMISLSYVCGSVDLTNPAAYNWYKEVIKKNMIKLGLGGWMADFGEYLPADAVLHNGKTGKQMHNEWPLLWAQMNMLALRDMRVLGDTVFFSRSGFSNMGSATTLMWAGDQNVDFSLADGLHSTITGALSMAMSGTGITHYDIGGYTTFGAQGLKRSEELLLRSAELAIWGPVFRTHEGNQPVYNVQWYTNTSTAAFARLAEKFALLKDYRTNVTKITSTKGIPIQSPVFLYFEDADGPETQFMWGSDVLVCPVYLQHATHQTAVLPKSKDAFTWIHVWSGKSYPQGSSQTVKAPVGYPAVFYRSDSQYKKLFQKLKDRDYKL